MSTRHTLAVYPLPSIHMVRLDPSKEQNLPERIAHGLLRLDTPYAVIGELEQMPDHIVVLDMITGQAISGVHADRFEIIPQAEAPDMVPSPDRPPVPQAAVPRDRTEC